MTLQEWMAAQRGGRADSVTPAAPVTPAPEEDLTPGTFGPMRHATPGDSPSSAFIGELARTGKEAAIGLAKSPLDLVKNLFNTVAHPVDTVEGLAHTVRHPVEAVKNLAANPREAGSLLGQLLLAPEAPGAANEVLASGPTAVGRGVSAVGRGAEALGKSKLAKIASKYGPMEAVFRGDPLGVAAAAVPPILEYGGKGLQKLGGSLEGLDLSIGRNKPDPFAEAAALKRVSTEVPGSSYVEPNAFTGNGPKAAPGSDVPFSHEGFLDSLKQSAGVTPEVPNGGLAESPAFTGLQNAVRRSNMSPAQLATEDFIASEPQIGVAGGGRTVGRPPQLARDVFGDPTENLDTMAAGISPDTHLSAKTLAQLSEASGRALSPDDAQAILNKYKNFRSVP